MFHAVVERRTNGHQARRSSWTRPGHSFEARRRFGRRLGTSSRAGISTAVRNIPGVGRSSKFRHPSVEAATPRRHAPPGAERPAATRHVGVPTSVPAAGLRPASGYQARRSSTALPSRWACRRGGMAAKQLRQPGGAGHPDKRPGLPHFPASTGGGLREDWQPPPLGLNMTSRTSRRLPGRTPLQPCADVGFLRHQARRSSTALPGAKTHGGWS